MSAAPNVLFVFVDGVGIAPPGADNPLSTLDLPASRRLADGHAWTADAPIVSKPDHVFRPVDANLETESLPQSGTGQAALFSGVNAAKVHGRHFGPYPPTRVRPVVEQESIFAQLVRRGVAPDEMAFANAYPDRFFAALEKRGRWTVTTLAASSAGVRLRRADDLARGEALAADITGRGWRLMIDHDIEQIEEEAAAARLLALSEKRAFALFEFFLTDKAGHNQDARDAAKVLRSLDRFLGALIDQMDTERQLLVLCSDHGNIEDLSTKGHTRNPVPLVGFGAGAETLAGATSILDVTPALLSLIANR